MCNGPKLIPMHVLIPIQMGTAPNLVPISVLIVVTIGISPSAALLHIIGICVGIGVGIGLCQCKHTIGAHLRFYSKQVTH